MSPMKLLLLSVAMLALSGCAKHSVCWMQGEGANVHGSFGYFYDSAEVTSTGPSTFKRVHKDATIDPCSGVSLDKNT